MQYVFITRTIDTEGNLCSGEKIHAKSWEEAEKRAQQLGVEVLGILFEERTTYDYDDSGLTA